LAKKDGAILFLETSLLKSTAFKLEKKMIKRLEIEGRFTKKRIVNSCIIDNLLWVCAQDGLYIYELSDRKIVLRRHLFKDKLITKVIKDNLDNYWVASHDKGLFIIPNIAFNTIKSDDFMSDIKHHYNTTQDFYIQDIDNRLFKFSTQTKTFTKINHKAKRDVKYVFENQFSSEINVTTIKKNNILNSSDLSFNKSKEIRSVYKEVNFINQNVFLKSSNRNSGFFKLETNREFFGKPIFKIPGRSYANAYCKALKKAYFANINGLYVVDSVYQKQEILINGQRIFAKDIVINSDNEIWVLCFKNEILKIKNDEVVEELNLKNGLLNEINSHIYFYDNHLWILGNSGIQVYNQSTKRFVNITKQDGLPSYDFKGINIKDDIVFITSSKEIIYFTIGAYKKQIKLHNPYITKVVGNGTNIELAKNVEFPSEIEKVDVFFNTNGLFSKETINYKFKLNDGEWENLNKGANVVSFNRISSGSYNLKIIGFYDGLVSAPIDFNFIIKTPFYKNWIFILVIISFTTALIWYFLSKKNKRIQLQQEIKLHKQNQELENINLKLENLRSQMNPHFIFNALNSIQDYILRNETTLARHFLVKFSRLIRMYLEHTQIDSLVLNDEIEALTLYLDLEKDRFSKDFNYSINLCKNTNQSQINLPPFLIQPYVENAIKHGLMHKKGAKNLTLNFNITDKNIFICEITDDGIGFQKSREINQKQSSHKSFSTGANNKRIELLNKTRSSEITLQIVNLEKEGTTSGTKIVLKIPQQKAIP
jgi:sensor histidine kinase YesM